ncbi:MAG: tryptophan permease [Alphaproteobacteria bacterium]
MEVMMTDRTENSKTPSLIGGGMIIAGTAVGAGMFAIPVVSAGMWSMWATLALIITWFCMMHSGFMILETNLNYPQGSSFDTIVKDTLGKGWNIFNGITVAFVGYILAYAYISGGGSIVSQTLETTIGYTPPQKLAGILFALGLAFFVWLSTKAVDRITTILIFGMIITFFMSVSGLTFNIKAEYLFNTLTTEKISYFPFIFAALPALLTSFGYHHSVPSLMKYYGKSPRKIITCIIFGTVLALIFYIFWLFAILGNIPRSHFGDIIAQGGNVGVLVGAVSNVIDGKLTSNLLSMFANMAVASSFLGVTLGLFDYLADLFKFDDSRLGRTKTAAVLYIPPLIGGIFFPNGFIIAIGFAGLAATVWAAIVPALMAKASRQKFGNPLFRTWGGNILVYIIIIYGIVIAICHTLSMLNKLPTFG